MKIVLDQFNSDIFKIKSGNIIEISNEDNFKDVLNILEKVRSENYRFITAKVSCTSKRLTNNFLMNHFVLTDTQVAYELLTNQIIKREYSFLKKGFIFKKVNNEIEDIEKIKNIAQKSFVLDQFHSNPFLNNKLCDLYYAKWSENSCNGYADLVFKVENKNEIVAFITLHIFNEQVRVGLAAVLEQYRGQGIFKFMIWSTLEFLKKMGKHKLIYGTQLCNQPAIRAMEYFNGKLTESNYVLHYNDISYNSVDDGILI